MKQKVIAFYTHSARAFRNTLIGYFYELTQKYDVVLISETLDQNIISLLEQKKNFQI